MQVIGGRYEGGAGVFMDSYRLVLRWMWERVCLNRMRGWFGWKTHIMHALRDMRSPAVENYAVGVNWLGNLE